jgi:HEPN superfamily RiboL-PSP-like protein
MFSVFTAGLRSEIETVKHVLETHDRFRTLVFSSPLISDEAEEAAATGNEPVRTAERPGDQLQERLDEIRRNAPSKSSWQVYDHCAAFTRLYAVYEQFIEELISDYLRILPELYEKYEDLPEGITKQHRIGTGQILLKLGKDGPYKHLDEKQVIANLAQALVGGAYYKLLRDAFLIDPQNYRAEVLGRLFGYLGIENCWTWIEKHPLVVAFMDRERDKTETPATVLNEFVEYRNKAAHTSVAETVATEEVKSIADCIMVICEALAQLVMKHVVRRREHLGQMSIAGEVIHEFSDCIVGAKMRAGAVAVGDEMVVVQKYACYKVGVRSIQIEHTPYERLDVNDGQEIGLRLAVAVKGALLMTLPASLPSTPQEAPQEPPSPDEFPLTEPEVAPPDTDSL